MLELKQPLNGYKYNSDTIVLYDFVSLFSPKGRVLDIGSGCGILSLLIKRDFKIEVVGVEKQKEMFEISLENSRVNNLEVEFCNENFSDFQSTEKFDFIVSNPPFYNHKSSTSTNESKKIARYDDNLSLDLFIKKTNSFIKTDGEFIFCYEAVRLQEVMDKLIQYKFKIKTMMFVHGSERKSSNIVLIRAVKTKVGQCEILPPFLFSNEKRVKEISLRANTKSLT
ncbi:MAG: methyltransferase [Campylobacterales bacterium]|nr:methyltransferase [Campylobacterales bacterium]